MGEARYVRLISWTLQSGSKQIQQKVELCDWLIAVALCELCDKHVLWSSTVVGEFIYLLVFVWLTAILQILGVLLTASSVLFFFFDILISLQLQFYNWPWYSKNCCCLNRGLCVINWLTPYKLELCDVLTGMYSNGTRWVV